MAGEGSLEVRHLWDLDRICSMGLRLQWEGYRLWEVVRPRMGMDMGMLWVLVDRG